MAAVSRSSGEEHLMLLKRNNDKLSSSRMIEWCMLDMLLSVGRLGASVISLYRQDNTNYSNIHIITLEIDFISSQLWRESLILRLGRTCETGFAFSSLAQNDAQMQVVMSSTARIRHQISTMDRDEKMKRLQKSKAAKAAQAEAEIRLQQKYKLLQDKAKAMNIKWNGYNHNINSEGLLEKLHSNSATRPNTSASSKNSDKPVSTKVAINIILDAPTTNKNSPNVTNNEIKELEEYFSIQSNHINPASDGSSAYYQITPAQDNVDSSYELHRDSSLDDIYSIPTNPNTAVYIIQNQEQ
jgi:hypothetical protein